MNVVFIGAFIIMFAAVIGAGLYVALLSDEGE